MIVPPFLLAEGSRSAVQWGSGVSLPLAIMNEPADCSTSHGEKTGETQGSPIPREAEGSLLRLRLAELEELLARWHHDEGSGHDPAEVALRLSRLVRVHSALAALAEAFISPDSDDGEVAELVLQHARVLTGSADGIVATIDAESGECVFRTMGVREEECRVALARKNIIAPDPQSGRYHGIWGHALNTRKGFFTNDPKTRPAWVGLPARHMRLESFLAVPALSGGDLLGLIALTGSPTGYTSADLEAVELLAAEYALFLDRRRRDEELRGERDRVRQYLDIAGVMLLALDAAGKIILVNRRGCEVLDDEESDLIGADWFARFVPEREREITRATFAQLMTGEVEPVERFENSIVSATGRERRIAWHNTLLRDASGRIIGSLSSGEDITEQRRREHQRRQIEARMQHAQKLESLGVLAGGMAHDFNNILQSVLGNVSLVLDTDAVDPAARENLKEALRATRRASGLCRQMLAYSGKGRFVIDAIDFGAFLAEMEGMLEVSIPDGVDFEIESGPDLPAIEGDATQLRQLVMNLVSNAGEAIGEGPGTIRLECRAVELTEPHPASSPNATDLPPGRYLRFELFDTGAGMDHETRARAFEPFFSTRFPGRGLGLPAAEGIVRSHRGSIAILPRPEGGTRLSILLPASDLEPTPDVPHEPDPGAWRRRGKVLLVDDEEALRDLGRRMLENDGVKVLCAEDGVDAVEVFSKHADEICCVLLDLSMPKLSGEETLHALREIRDDIPVVLCSGYSDVEVSQRFAGKGIDGFLPKPFSRHDLLAMLRDVIS